MARAEIETTVAAMKAEHAVLVALDPDITVIEEELNRLAREGIERPPDENDSEAPRQC